MGRDSKLNPFGRDNPHRPPVGVGGALQIPGATHPALGAPIVRDAFGRPLLEGDQIFVQTGHLHPFAVRSINASVNPTVPGDLLEVVVTATLRFLCPRNQPNQEFVRIMQASEMKRPETEAVRERAEDAADQRQEQVDQETKMEMKAEDPS